MNCDICSAIIKNSQGYVLSTKQVVYQSAYWRRAFQLLPIAEDKLEGFLPTFVQKMAGSESDWIVCGECISNFDMDKTKASNNYQEHIKTGRRPFIPDAGAADFSRAAMIASSTFESVFGRKPKTIQITGEEAKTIDSEEFSRLFAASYKSKDKEGLKKAAEHKIRCNECGSVMYGVETKMTKTGMNCPRCGKAWMMLMKRKKIK